MKKGVYIGFVILILLAALLAACGGAKDEGGAAALDGKALVEERCSVCHDLERVEAAKKSAEEWKTNVERMVGNGAKLNQEEQEAVIEYLTKAYPK